MTEKMGPYVVSRCPCGQRGCEDWHVSPVAAVQCVKFTERQARAAAAVLTAMDEEDPRAGALALVKWVRDAVADVPDADWQNEVCYHLDVATNALEFGKEFRS